jgi:hypothetical protein
MEDASGKENENPLLSFSSLLDEGILKLDLTRNHELLLDHVRMFQQFDPTTAVDLIFRCDPRESSLNLTQTLGFELINMFNLSTSSRQTSIRWHELFLEVLTTNPHFHYALSNAVIHFPKICLNYNLWPLSQRNVPLETAYGILPALVMPNTNLKELYLSYCQLMPETLDILSHGILKSVALERLVFSHIRFEAASDSNHRVMERHDNLAHALSCQRKLKVLEIRNCFISESLGCQLLYSLENHPSLQNFAFEGKPRGTSLNALCRVLMGSHCRISSLDVSESDLGNSNELGRLLNAIRRNNISLKNIDLSENNLGNSHVIEILDCIHDCPHLVKVDLSGNDRIDDIDFAQSGFLTGSSQTSKLRQLDLQDYFEYHQHENEEAMILQLLESNPYLCDLGLDLTDCQQRFSPQVVYLMDLNLFGRSLMINHSRDPPSLWPVIIERSNIVFANFPGREASVIYHWLNKGSLFHEI